jgi:hypothetical protein
MSTEHDGGASGERRHQPGPRGRGRRRRRSEPATSEVRPAPRRSRAVSAWVVPSMSAACSGAAAIAGNWSPYPRHLDGEIVRAGGWPSRKREAEWRAAIVRMSRPPALRSHRLWSRTRHRGRSIVDVDDQAGRTSNPAGPRRFASAAAAVRSRSGLSRVRAHLPAGLPSWPPSWRALLRELDPLAAAIIIESYQWQSGIGLDDGVNACITVRPRGWVISAHSRAA